MRNLKKILALVLAMVMVLSMMVTASAAFSDAEDINPSYAEAVEVLSGLGVIRGMENADGTMRFDPTGTLTRAQAATIIAYVMEGSLDNIDALVDAVDFPFTDVPSWARPYVAYAYSKGVIIGRNATTYAPSDVVTGFEFGKMLLVAAGVCENADFVGEGVNWKLVVSENLKDAGIWKGSDFALSKKLTREEACYLAWNALNWSATGTTSVYVVTDSAEKVIYTGTDALTALVMAQSATGNKLALQSTSEGSLADTVFNLTTSTVTDAFGRESKTYINAKNPKVVYAAIEPTAVLTYTTGTTYGKIVSALGYTSVEDEVTFNVYDNSKDSTEVTATRTSNATTDAIGGTGTLIEVYAEGTNEYQIVVIDTYVHQLAETDITKAVAATPTSDAVPAYITIDEMDYVTNAFKKDDVVLYTVADDKIVNVVKAAYVSGYVTATNKALGYIRVDGVTKLISANAENKEGTKPNIGDAGYTYSNTDAYTYFLDSYGNVIYAVAGQKAQPDVKYTYVINVAAKKAGDPVGDLFDTAAGTPAAAQAQVMDLATGAISVVDLGIVLGTDGKYYYADNTGAASETEVTEIQASAPFDTGIYTYVELDDGSYVIGDTAVTGETVTLVKNTAAITGLDGKYANAGTKVTVLTFTDKYASVSKTEYNGFTNFPATGLELENALVVDADNNGVVESILAVIPAPDVVTLPDYAIFAGLGEDGAKGQAYAFYVNGELGEYFLAKDVEETDAFGTVPAAGTVVKLTLTNGALGDGAVESAGDSVKEKTVTVADSTYIVVDGVVYYYGEGCQIYTYDAEGKLVTATVEVGDTVSVYYTTSNNIKYAGFIMK